MLVCDYAVSRNVTKSRAERRYTGGALALARRAVRFGRALIFLCYFLCIKTKKVNKRYEVN